MENLNIQELLEQMLGATKEILNDHWKEAEPFANQEFKAFAENMELISRLLLEGKITVEQARSYVEIQKSSVRVVLLTIQGLGLLAVERAINAALDVVRDVVNHAVGLPLI